MNIEYVHDFYVDLLSIFGKSTKGDTIVNDSTEAPIEVKMNGEKYTFVVAGAEMKLDTNEIVFNPLADIAGGTVSTTWLYGQIKVYITNSVDFIMNSLFDDDARDILLKTEAFEGISKNHLNSKVRDALDVLKPKDILRVNYNGHRKLIQITSPLFDDEKMATFGFSKATINSLRKIISCIMGTNNIAAEFKHKSVKKEQAFLGLMLDLLIQYLETTQELLSCVCGYNFELDELVKFRSNLVELGAVMNRVGDTPLPAAKNRKPKRSRKHSFSVDDAPLEIQEEPVRRTTRVRSEEYEEPEQYQPTEDDPINHVGDILHGRYKQPAARQLHRKVEPQPAPLRRREPMYEEPLVDPRRRPLVRRPQRRIEEYAPYDEYDDDIYAPQHGRRAVPVSRPRPRAPIQRDPYYGDPRYAQPVRRTVREDLRNPMGPVGEYI